MDSGNSGSMSSSGDEEYDSVPDLLNPHAQVGCFTSQTHPHSSLNLVSSSSHHHHPIPCLFDVSPSTYLQVQPNINIPVLNLEAAPPNSQAPRSDRPNCTALPSAGSAGVTGSPARNPKKRTRASRRAPTTVLTTDTSNFRAMVQEFTGIPAPPFSSSSYSRRLDLLALASSSSCPSSSASPSSFYPLRPSPHKLIPPNNTSLLSSSPSTLLPDHNMADANISDHVGVPYNHPHPQQHMVTMQVLPFQTPISLLPFPNPLHAPGFSPKSQPQPQLQPSLSVPSSLEDQLGLGMRHAHPHLVTPHTTDHSHAPLSTSQAEHTPLTTTTQHDLPPPTPHAEAPTHHPFTTFPPTACKLNFSASSSSSTFNLDNNNNNNLDNSSTRGEGNHNNNIDSWICSSD